MKTAPTAEHLAIELDKLGLTTLAQRARENFYHDFFSSHHSPSMELARDLFNAAKDAKSEAEREAIMHLRERHVRDGAFDADLKEAEMWRESDEGQKVLGGF